MFQKLKKLLERPFIRGYGSVLNCFGNSYKKPSDFILSKSDTEALASDWKSIGADFKSVLKSAPKV